MPKKLGLCVSSDQHLDHIVKLCQAARRQGIEVIIFFTHLGTRLTNEPEFKQLAELARMSLCNVSFEEHKLIKPVPGINDHDFANQSRHGDLIFQCDRYLAF